MNLKSTGNGVFQVKCFASLALESNPKMRAALVELSDEYAIISMKLPRSSKRVQRIIPRDEFIVFSYNEDTEALSFLTNPVRQEVATVYGTVELNGGYVYVTEEDGTVHIFHEEDVEIIALDGASERKPRAKKAAGGKRGRKAKLVEEEEEEEEEEDDSDDEESDEDDSDDEESDDDSEDSDEDESDEDDDSDEDESDEDDDSDEDESDEDDDSDEDDEDDEDEDEDDDSDEDDEDDDDEDEDEAPRRKRHTARRGR